MGAGIVLISMSTASRDSALSDSCSTSQWTHPLFCSVVLNYSYANQQTFIKKITDRGGRFLKSDSRCRPPGLYCLCCHARRLWALWNSLQCEYCGGGERQRGFGPYLQSIFSTRYAHIRNPVLLKPCVQWTPSGEKTAQWSKMENLHLYFNLRPLTQHS